MFPQIPMPYVPLGVPNTGIATGGSVVSRFGDGETITQISGPQSVNTYRSSSSQGVPSSSFVSGGTSVSRFGDGETITQVSGPQGTHTYKSSSSQQYQPQHTYQAQPAYRQQPTYQSQPQVSQLQNKKFIYDIGNSDCS